MTNFWLDTINVICASALVTLSFIDNISKRSFAKKSKPLRDSLTYIKKGRVKFLIIIFLGAISIWVYYEKNQNVISDQTIAAKTFKSELKSRDSINQIDFNKSLSSATSASSSASAKTMAKYYLMYDSAQHTIERLVKDSSKKVVKNTYGNHPELAVNDIVLKKHTQDSIVFSVIMYTKQSACYHTKLIVHMVLGEENKPYYFIKDDPKYFINDILIPLDKGLEIPRYILGNNSRIKNEIYYFILVGSYFDLDGRKFEFKSIYTYNMSTKSFGSISEPDNTLLINFIHQQGIDY